MAILLDTGFYFALIASKDLFHDRAREIWQEISTGKYGRTYTTDYVLDEVFTLLNVRTHGKRKDLLMKLKDFFLGNEPIATLIKIEISWLNEIAQIQ
jgi:predicted nucleic acid-binding protein